MSLTEKTAFISGAGRNIGRAIALQLAGRGCNVIINGSQDRAACDAVAAEAVALGVQSQVAIGDVGDPDAVHTMAEAALDRFGHVDIVANNAAIRPSKAFLELTLDDWRRVLAVDLDAAFHTSQAFLPGMVEQNWGRIINFTGMNAIHGYAGRAPVSVAKHGVWGLTKALAKEFGPKGITVNAISPGPIRGERDDLAQTQHIEEMVSRVPLGHLGEPDQVAAFCGFLASEEGGFVTGQMLACNGGAET
ncbi:MAG: SDR family oxidoreductase [Rhodospirillaceae bacterium]|nr:SDR family oxidoreductase [Rhodospirillaceae bacterium]